MPLGENYKPLGDIANLTLAKPDMSKTYISTVNCLLLITVYLLVRSCREAATMHFGAALQIAHALQKRLSNATRLISSLAEDCGPVSAHWIWMIDNLLPVCNFALY